MVVFNKWAHEIPSLLSKGGVVLGTTMSPMNEAGEIAALQTMSHELGNESVVKYFHIMPPVDTKRYLELQHAGVIEEAKKNGDTLLVENIQHWIDDNSKKYPKLAYVYLEASNKGGHQSIYPLPELFWNNHGLKSLEDLARASKTSITAYHEMLKVHSRQAVLKRIASLPDSTEQSRL